MAADWKKDYNRYKGFFLDTYTVYKDKNNIKVFLELLLSIAAIGIFVIFALKPTIVTIIDLTKQIRAKEEVIAIMDTKIQSLSTAQTIYAQESRRIALLNTAIPDKPEPHKLIQQIQGVTTSSGVDISSATIEEAILKGIAINSLADPDIVLPEGSLSLGFSISGNGAYTSIESFLEDLENMRRPAFIKSFSVRSIEDSGGEGLSVSTEGSAIYFDTNQ